MTAGPLIGAGASAGLAVLGAADSGAGIESYIGDVVGVGGLAGVVVFLFRWAQQQLAAARAEGAQAVADAKAEGAGELAAMRDDRDLWRDRYLALVEHNAQ